MERPINVESLIEGSLRPEPFSEQMLTGPFSFAWCIRIFNEWHAHRRGVGPLTWSKVLDAAGTAPDVLSLPRLTHADFAWNRARTISNDLYGPPEEGFPNPATQVALHNAVDRSATNEVVCAYWVGGNPHVAALATSGVTVRADDLEYVVMAWTTDKVGDLFSLAVEYPEWMVSSSGSWALSSGKDSPFVELAGDDLELLQALVDAKQLEIAQIHRPTNQ